MYYLYLDESGDDGDYFEGSDGVKGGSSKFFTLGGLIVDETSRYVFENVLQGILTSYFKNVKLPPKFKLHYTDLREGKSPYDSLGKPKLLEISNRIFGAITSINCSLLSVTIDIEKHCKKYDYPVNPRAYALYLILERFQHFLQLLYKQGEVIYERYNSVFRKKVQQVHNYFLRNEFFPTFTSFQNIIGHVKNGDPTTEPVLIFSDFMAYAPWIKSVSQNQKVRRWNEIKHKYFRLDHANPFLRGNYEL
jgi:hypothetical protein